MIHSLRMVRIGRLLALLITSIGAITTLPQQVFAQQPTTQPIVIVVRDGAGNPMMGVPILIKIASDPPQDCDQCVTAEDGACTVQLLPDQYLIQFVQGWRGRPFIPVEQQLSFGLTVMPSDQVGYSTFVIAEQDGRLVPVWDMSRDPEQPPQPFMPSFNGEDPLAPLDLGPLTTALPGATQPGSAPATSGTATATSQVVVDVIGSGAGTPITAATPTPAPAAAQPPSTNIGMIVIAMIGIGILIALALLILFSSRDARKER
jgi:hypothetical protein